jgi:hypothetical protein
MDSFAFWLDRPFDLRRISRRARRRTRTVTIRYRGSLGRSAVKTLVVLALLAVMASVIGDRASQELGANEVTYRAGAAAPRR